MDQNPSNYEKINLFRSLFKGREDVFAIHWQKGNKSGYMPAYQFDPYRYRLHKMKGGTLKTFQDKTNKPLNDQQIEKHLKGEQLIGIYPLLQDNTSWFIAADFDKENWKEECLKVLNICHQKGIPAYLERSRSGNGGHIWVFFQKPYSAQKSRMIFKVLLEKAGVFSVFEKNPAFDRLFPNQDYHTGKGLGNLIALPLYKPALEQGNSCFVDSNFNPHPDQWHFLSTISKIPFAQLDELYESFTKSPPLTISTGNGVPGKLRVTLKNAIYLNRSGIPKHLIYFLKETLNFSNSEYFIKKNAGKNTYGTTPYFKLIEETENEVIIPRGFVGRLLRYCKQQKIDYQFDDQRTYTKPIHYTPQINLLSHQQTVVKTASKKDFGVISAPPGSGKTVIGLKIVAEKQQPALIIIHRKHLLEQWLERIPTFLGIPKHEIGIIGQGKNKPGQVITLAMIQSLEKFLNKPESQNSVDSIGTVILDECHHIPAKSFKNTFSKLAPYYQYGLTATPFRKGNDDKIIFFYIGELIAKIESHEIEQLQQPEIIIRNTDLEVPFNAKTDSFETLSKILVHDSARNKLILDDVKAELNTGKKVVLLTERKEHIETLYQFLKQSYETIKLSGEDPENRRKSKWETLKAGNFQVLITTGQYFGEGTDINNISCLFLVYPFSFKGKLIQYIGRVQRSEITPVIYDYRDHKIDYLNRIFLKRNAWYRQLDRQLSIFEKPKNTENYGSNSFKIDKQIKIPLNECAFHFGAVVFKYSGKDLQQALEFEIENDEIRPEFEVLKPYFIKTLGKKNIGVHIYAEFQKNELIAQWASSPDLVNINREIIDSVKFRYIENKFFGKSHYPKSGNLLLDLENLNAHSKDSSLYDSEEELLDNLLNNKNYQHSRQLRYLASQHNHSLLKIRFVLNPFSFVFLITGNKMHHIILETLDTEEATYIWHLEKDKSSLNKGLNTINKDLHLIRNKGRQTFLENPPENFTRILHDNSNDRSGFIKWKDALEERLI